MKNLNPRTAAIILTAGAGSRLKSMGPKPLLPYKNKTFTEVVVEKVTQVNLDPIILVTNNSLVSLLKELKLPVNMLINPHPEKGMLSSLLIGLEALTHASCQGFLLNPIDYPLVEQNTYRTLITAFGNNNNYIVKPSFNSKSGHPIIVPMDLVDELKQAPINRGARYVTEKYAYRTRYVSVNDPGILLNINTPQLYKKYCE